MHYACAIELQGTVAIVDGLEHKNRGVKEGCMILDDLPSRHTARMLIEVYMY